jgi:hypothetical protein
MLITTNFTNIYYLNLYLVVSISVLLLNVNFTFYNYLIKIILNACLASFQSNETIFRAFNASCYLELDFKHLGT